MAVVLDTTGIPMAARRDAVHAVIEATAVPMHVVYQGAADPRGSRWDHWPLGRAHLMRTQASGLQLSRTRRLIRQGDPEIVALSYNVEGRTVCNLDRRQTVRGSDLSLTDLGQPCSLTWDLPYSCIAFNVDRNELGLSADVIRRASDLLHTSPLHSLVQGHLQRMSELAQSPPDAVTTALLGASTIELVRALVATAGRDDENRNPAMQDALPARLLSYLQQNLRDPELTPERIASALGVSLRHLYNVWDHSDLTLTEWIIQERLAGARHELALPSTAAVTISALARRWGFRDAAHFSRRFRQAYGLSPREWRDLHTI